MSQIYRVLRLTPRTIALAFVLSLSLATASSAQFPTTYVCQTPAFWCVFQWTSGFPNGTPCYCTTGFGPVSGYTINPAGVPNAPTLPSPQPQNPGNPPPSQPRRTGDAPSGDDCYKGLGNCPGSFANTSRNRGGSGESAGSTSDQDADTPDSSRRTYKGSLAEGSNRRITLALRAGRSYVITGKCSLDCADLDLILRRGTTVVDEDTGGDDVPIVSLSARSGADYVLEVKMENCSETRCSYTVEVEED